MKKGRKKKITGPIKVEILFDNSPDSYQSELEVQELRNLIAEIIILGCSQSDDGIDEDTVCSTLD